MERAPRGHHETTRGQSKAIRRRKLGPRVTRRAQPRRHLRPGAGLQIERRDRSRHYAWDAYYSSVCGVSTQQAHLHHRRLVTAPERYRMGRGEWAPALVCRPPEAALCRDSQSDRRLRARRQLLDSDYIVTQSRQNAPRENIRVLASHIGMTFSPWVLLAVADRLLADRDHWQPFDASRYLPGALKGVVPVMYPSAEVASRAHGHAKAGARDSRSKVVDRLLDEHRCLNGLVRVLESRSSKHPGMADYYLLRDIVGYVHDYAERVHHPTEDLLVRKLLLRKPGAKGLVERLQREHDSASMATRKLLDQLDELIKKPAAERARAVRKACVAFAERQRAHMRFEDEKIFPCGVASLSSADWRTIEARLFASEDPLFGRKIGARHRVLYEYLLAHEKKLHAALVERSTAARASRVRGRRRGLPAVAGAQGSI
nr:putative hemerythrin [uncultured bacterium]